MSASPISQKSASKKAAFAALTVLFFAWGFITSLIDPLVAAVKGIFTLSSLEAQLSAFAFFIAYGVMSFPAAAIIGRIRAVPAILLALTTMTLACLVMLWAANIASYPLVLTGLFMLAAGITVLQVAANPLAAAMGNPEGSHFRLTLSQTFNSFGTFLGPALGASLFLKGVEVSDGVALTPEVREAALAGIDRAYFWICGLLIVLLAFFFFNRARISAAAPPAQPTGGIGSLLAQAFSSRWAVLGAGAIFIYVGAEVAIGTQMAFYLSDKAIWGASLEQAGKAVSFYWGGAMVGRAVGTVLLARFPAAKLMMLFAAIAAAMCAYLFLVGGVSAGYIALSIGLFNSIMYPVIFTLTLERSSASEEATSGLLCTGIIGGALIPALAGAVTDAAGIFVSYLLPMACYILLAAFAASATKAPVLRRPERESLH
ncbi:MFS transporter [Novosphingobium sp.]|uniref:MFS transporter n=1 Tax=Novosphingobium sp. TaxID=1874826 RepID=UPI002632EE10|nr:MFS transporter [Novosphingobium sp.]